MRARIAIALAGLVISTTALSNTSPQGTWISSDGGTKVRVSDCGGALCGTVVWLREPVDATGRPKTDRHNPDESKRSRPMLGLQVIHGMRPSGANKWSGEIYNADDGKTYRSHLTLLSDNHARVEGCVLVFCKGENWQRTN